MGTAILNFGESNRFHQGNNIHRTGTFIGGLRPERQLWSNLAPRYRTENEEKSVKIVILPRYSVI